MPVFYSRARTSRNHSPLRPCMGVKSTLDEATDSTGKTTGPPHDKAIETAKNPPIDPARSDGCMERRFYRGPLLGRTIAVRRAALERRSNLTRWAPVSITSQESFTRPSDEARNTTLMPRERGKVCRWLLIARRHNYADDRHKKRRNQSPHSFDGDCRSLSRQPFVLCMKRQSPGFEFSKAGT